MIGLEMRQKQASREGRKEVRHKQVGSLDCGGGVVGLLVGLSHYQQAAAVVVQKFEGPVVVAHFTATCVLQEDKNKEEESMGIYLVDSFPQVWNGGYLFVVVGGGGLVVGWCR